MIRLHGVTLSNYYNKVKLVLLEKGLPFEEVLASPRKLSAEQLAISPLGKVPFVEVGGTGLCESQVIVDYLEAAHPKPALLPADPMAAAKVRELIQFMELYVEWVGRELYVQAYFGGQLTEAVREGVRSRLERNLAALARMARFSPYLAGEAFSLADAAGFATLPTVANATKAVYGEDLVAAAGIDWKAHMALLGARASVQRINADRKRDAQAAAAAASASKG